MRRVFAILLFLPLFISAQNIGELAPEKPPEEFPPNSWGMDILIGDGGFGLGTFFRHAFNSTVTGFIDFSISESKDDREFEYIDIFGRSVVLGKENRVFFLPLNAGVQYRLFEKTLTSNLRPYVTAGAGPTLLVTTPYRKEFFSSFGDARLKYAVGGYIGMGANFGISKSNLVGLNFRYYAAYIFGEGVENLTDRFRNKITSFYVTLNLGIMY
ncbi:MAG: hypothetical protein JW995_10045 [Melioribacteraceae bacterium]|nr:hypothetical protein [Melioribacteraceae bacterium]